MRFDEAEDKTAVRINRSIALYHLRINPKGHKQAFATLRNSDGCRCALGLIAEGLGFDVPVQIIRTNEVTAEELGKYADLLNVVYGGIEEKLAIDPYTVWGKNDTQRLSFNEIADVLEEEWSEEERAWLNLSGPVLIQEA